VLRFGGHVFSGIARMDLLTLLQWQAGRLGVDLRFQHDVGDLSAVSGYDLVVGADGINSLVRRELAERFWPTVHVGRSKFIWLGTTKVFDALTFIFEESEHGWIGVHIYPYSPTASTFIVETDDATWRRAGFDRHADAASAPGQSDLESLKYCERLFAGHLDGHPLLANNSKWLNFPTVRNRAWHAGNVVLLGDAALRAKLGAAAQQTISERFTLLEMLAAYEKAYKEL
jgi:anthraniloyl-CoA monooxygenase